MQYLAALRYALLLGAAIFIFINAGKAQAGVDDAFYIAGRGINTPSCAAYDNGDQYCNWTDFQSAWAPMQAAGVSVCAFRNVGGVYTVYSSLGPIGAAIAAAAAAKQVATYSMFSPGTSMACQAAFDSGTTGSPTSFNVNYVCGDNTNKLNPALCPAVTCVSGTFAALELNISGPSPKSIEYVETCFSGCKYNISNASIYRLATGGEEGAGQYVMRGQYVNAGVVCSTGAENNVDPDEVQDPSPTGGGDGEEEEPATGTTTALGEIGALGVDMETGISTGVLGPILQFPSFGMFTSSDSGSGRVCSLALELPSSDAFAMIRAAMGDELTVDFCDYTDRIDTIGGFLLYMFTALGLWGIFRMTPGG